MARAAAADPISGLLDGTLGGGFFGGGGSDWIEGGAGDDIVLGDGGPRHADTLARLVEAGANVNIADRSGETPLSLARSRGYREMVSILSKAGAR